MKFVCLPRCYWRLRNNTTVGLANFHRLSIGCSHIVLLLLRYLMRNEANSLTETSRLASLVCCATFGNKNINWGFKLHKIEYWCFEAGVRVEISRLPWFCYVPNKFETVSSFCSFRLLLLKFGEAQWNIFCNNFILWSPKTPINSCTFYHRNLYNLFNVNLYCQGSI